MPRPLNFGVLGCARIVRRALIGAFQQAPGARLAAIASRDGAAARAWADEFAIPTAHGSYEALLADREIDAVYVPLPNELHLPWTVAAAQAGKHVLCEKPLALDARQAQSMVDACHQRGVLLMEAFMWRHHPRVAHARKMLADGLLGELRLVTMDFSFDIDRGDWRLDPRHGGGSLSDLGCYGINAARLFNGAEPVEVVARAARYQTGVDMTLSMLLRFPGDRMALLDSSFECPYRNRLEIVGTKGAISFPGGVLPRGQTELIVRSGGGEETIHFPATDQYAAQIECFCASVAAGRLVDPAEDGLANMKALDAVRHAMIDRSC
ncbi:MAG: Gfo/Idh/MocA family oxidoreductase [Planctomycetia bacterium]|nr:Gfo/Idh/MocA family oxidoreductase [Planctomycetia bacterium]